VFCNLHSSSEVFCLSYLSDFRLGSSQPIFTMRLRDMQAMTIDRCQNCNSANAVQIFATELCQPGYKPPSKTKPNQKKKPYDYSLLPVLNTRDNYTIPGHVLLRMLDYLSVRDICTISRVSKTFHVIANYPQLWHSMIINALPAYDDSQSNKDTDWKATYLQMTAKQFVRLVVSADAAWLFLELSLRNERQVKAISFPEFLVKALRREIVSVCD